MMKKRIRRRLIVNGGPYCPARIGRPAGLPLPSGPPGFDRMSSSQIDSQLRKVTHRIDEIIAILKEIRDGTMKIEKHLLAHSDSHRPPTGADAAIASLRVRLARTRFSASSAGPAVQSSEGNPASGAHDSAQVKTSCLASPACDRSAGMAG